MAPRLRRETTMSIKGIAAQVQLGSPKSVNAELGFTHDRSSV